MHKVSEHKGKLPKRLAKSLEREQQLKQLQTELRKAVADENYESAAQLRDRIKSMRLANIYQPQNYRHVISSIQVHGQDESGYLQVRSGFAGARPLVASRDAVERNCDWRSGPLHGMRGRTAAICRPCLNTCCLSLSLRGAVGAVVNNA